MRDTPDTTEELSGQAGGDRLPVGVPYAIKVESDAPVAVLHSRLDATQPAPALFTTMTYPEAGS